MRGFLLKFRLIEPVGGGGGERREQYYSHAQVEDWYNLGARHKALEIFFIVGRGLIRSAANALFMTRDDIAQAYSLSISRRVNTAALPMFPCTTMYLQTFLPRLSAPNHHIYVVSFSVKILQPTGRCCSLSTDSRDTVKHIPKCLLWRTFDAVN